MAGTKIMASAFDIIDTVNVWLKPDIFRDYCPNGLQVEGSRDKISKIACAVTASQYIIEQAISREADMLLVHHGLFWKGESPVIKGNKKKRLQALFDSGIHLLAYHLPLDAHPELGNNAQLAKILDLEIDSRVPESPDSLLYKGHLAKPVAGAEFCHKIEHRLHRKPLYIGDPDKLLQTIAWCSGAAQSFFPKAIEQNVDVFITGEISEQNYHQARESGVCFVAAGHHATERYGVQALAEELSRAHALEYFFIDQENPV